MMSGTLAIQRALEIKISKNKGYDITIVDYDVSNRILFREPNYIVDVVMWPEFDNCSISREIWHLTKEITFVEGGSWFKFSNFGLALGTSLKFYTDVAKVLKLKATKFWGISFTFLEVTGEKLVGDVYYSQWKNPG